MTREGYFYLQQNSLNKLIYKMDLSTSKSDKEMLNYTKKIKLYTIFMSIVSFFNLILLFFQIYLLFK